MISIHKRQQIALCVKRG